MSEDANKPETAAPEADRGRDRDRDDRRDW